MARAAQGQGLPSAVPGAQLIATPTIDLIFATVGRTEEPARFLQALEAQTYRNFRLIVVDQNEDDRLATLLAPFEGAFPVIRLTAERGLSRARNVALQHVGSDLVAFPDDDCWYPADVLERVSRFFSEHPEWDGLSGRAVDETGRNSAGRPDATAGAMTLISLWRCVASFTLFFRSQLIYTVGPFDETLGVGSGTPWGGGEDLDYVARALRSGCHVYYDPAFTVMHPRKREHGSRPVVRQGYAYGAGYGRALRKNRLPWGFAVYYLVRSFGAVVLNLLSGKGGQARFHWAVGKGRWRGWRSARPES